MKKFSSTMRASSRRTSRTKRRIGTFVIVAVVLLFLLWLVPQVLARVASVIITPIQATQNWLSESSGNLPSYLRDRNDLINQIESLREELAVRGGRDHSIEMLRTENEELRSLLGDDGENRILAAIIARPNALPYDVMVIDQGTNDGVVKDAPVYIGENRVIGLVTKVFPNSSVVELITTPGFTSSVFVIGPDIYTNAEGIGGGQLRIGVPQGIDIAVGNSVVLPAVATGVFGTISHVESLPTQPEQFGYVSSEIPIQSMHYVAIGEAPIEKVSFEEAQETVSLAREELFSVPVPEDVLVVTENATSTATSSDESAATTTEEES